nr:SUMF1/EgtB/PvdO family nonheme iron enzyme [uncultured Devosia sp.]
MTTRTVHHASIHDLVLPGILLLGLTGFCLSQLGILAIPTAPGIAPETLTIAARTYSYRLPGDFQKDGNTVNGLMQTVEGPATEVMRFQVSAADYQQCVADGVCEKPAPAFRAARADVPVTGVSYSDALDYAEWLSARTGDIWRLPTIAEWFFIAGDRAVDHGLEVDTGSTDPAQRWLARYEQETRQANPGDGRPQKLGSFGANDLGVMDIGGNVWEWTETCFTRVTLADDDTITRHAESCGVRYVEGRHISAMSVFVRDARGGGCSAGAPPDNLGFRLIREQGFWLRWPF